MTPSLPCRVTTSPNVLFQALQDEAVLLDLASEQYIGLDPVATRLWQLLTEHGDTTVVLNVLLAEYEVDAATLAQDLAAFIEQLCTAGLATIEVEAELAVQSKAALAYADAV
ncbi:MAG: PqqD family protein [Caldilineaceae bacterium]